MNSHFEIESDQFYQTKIYQTYQVALQTASAHVDLKKELLTELSTNITLFEATVTSLIAESAPKKIIINTTKFSLGFFWKPSCCGNGSTLRTALIKAKEDVDEIKEKYALFKQKAILNKLESDQLYWHIFEELHNSIDLNWSEQIKRDLAYLIDYKQAEFLFIKHILPYQINYRGAIFAIEDVLFQLCTNHNSNMNERIETSRHELNDFFIKIQNINFLQSLKYRNVANLFLEICKEWFQIGAAITYPNKVLDTKTGVFQIREVKLFWEKLGNAFSPHFVEHQILLNEISKKETGFDFLKLIMGKITAHQKNIKPTPNEDLFIYKMQQYLIWISRLPPDKEMVPIDVNLLKEFANKSLPLYSSLRRVPINSTLINNKQTVIKLTA